LVTLVVITNNTINTSTLFILAEDLALREIILSSRAMAATLTMADGNPEVQKLHAPRTEDALDIIIHRIILVGKMNTHTSSKHNKNRNVKNERRSDVAARLKLSVSIESNKNSNDVNEWSSNVVVRLNLSASIESNKLKPGCNVSVNGRNINVARNNPIDIAKNEVELGTLIELKAIVRRGHLGRLRQERTANDVSSRAATAGSTSIKTQMIPRTGALAKQALVSRRPRTPASKMIIAVLRIAVDRHPDSLT
jgi:hypothetical protein